MPPAQVTASTDTSSNNRTREGRPQLPLKSPTVLPGAGDPKQRPGSGPLLSSGVMASGSCTHITWCPQHKPGKELTQPAASDSVGPWGPGRQAWPHQELGVAPELLGFPHGTSGKEPAYQSKRWKRHQFDPWVGKIPWRRACQPTLVFLPGESHGQREPGGLPSIGLQSQTHMRPHQSCLLCRLRVAYHPPAPPKWALRGSRRS